MVVMVGHGEMNRQARANIASRCRFCGDGSEWVAFGSLVWHRGGIGSEPLSSHSCCSNSLRCGRSSHARHMSPFAQVLLELLGIRQNPGDTQIGMRLQNTSLCQVVRAVNRMDVCYD